MSTDFVAGDASNLASYTGGNDGIMKFRTGPNGAKVDALVLDASGKAQFPQGITGYGLTLGTAQNTTSGTSIDFTGIPSWVKRITVMFNGVSTNGASPLTIRGGAGSIDVTGYTSAASYGTVALSTSTAEFLITPGFSSAEAFTGHAFLTLVGSNTWVISGIGTSTVFRYFTGNKTFSGTLDRIRLTTVNGTDTFDAGSVNILYE